MVTIKSKTYRGSSSRTVTVRVPTKTGAIVKRIPVRTSYTVTVRTKR